MHRLSNATTAPGKIQSVKPTQSDLQRLRLKSLRIRLSDRLSHDHTQKSVRHLPASVRHEGSLPSGPNALPACLRSANHCTWNSFIVSTAARAVRRSSSPFERCSTTPTCAHEHHPQHRTSPCKDSQMALAPARTRPGLPRHLGPARVRRRCPPPLTQLRLPCYWLPNRNRVSLSARQ
jgi:hypothetical protein